MKNDLCEKCGIGIEEAPGGCGCKTIIPQCKTALQFINCNQKPPSKNDSPILAWGYDRLNNEGYIDCAALHWLNDDDGWNGEGWYDHSNEYGMKVDQIEFWIPLPRP